jgi:filamentous hemagglutinin
MRMRRERIRKLHTAVIALGAWAVWSRAGGAGPALPVPCAPGACGAAGPSQFVTAGTATAVATQNALKINQATNSAILNWSSFNIGANGTVTFKQPTASSIALNRIFQASPSQIFGHLSANGQVYLINLNGFVFGSTARVNVGSLLASTLPLALTDSNFGSGILAPLQTDKPVFDATLDPLAPGVGRTSVLDANGNPVLDANGKPLAVQIAVQPGAQLTAADQGRLLLAGQSVTNGGTLTAPDGQVVLAAGTQVFLQADNDPSLRGLIVEVDGNGTASNQLTGLLSAPRGNITMVGLAVNQRGRISATTSVSANGSIRLEAASGAAAGGSGDQTVASTQGGALTVGPNSEMQILPELASSETAVSAQTQYPSSITLLGEQVLLQGGAIAAPGGNLTAIAAANPSLAAADPAAGVSATRDPNARLRIDAGTAIDLSGSEASLPVTANLVAAQLRSSELADDPTQRNGSLHGLTVYIDARRPPPADLADVSGEIAAIPQNVAQRTENGGHAVFQSEGDVVFARGAGLNVSGGATTYAGGVMQTSYLVGANGQLYPVATANPLLSYVGVVNPTFTQTYDKWGVQDVLPTPGLSAYQPGYVQGAPAGSVQFAAPTMVLQGSLQGSAVNGLYQRTPSTAVQGGQLIIGVPGGVGESATTPPIDYLSPAVRLATTPTPIIVADDASLPGPLTLELPVSYLTGSGFTSTRIYSNFDVTLPPGLPLALPSGSTFTVNAARVDILSNITDPGGTLGFQDVFSLGSQSATTNRPGVYIGNGVTLDVRGLWTNDSPSANTPALSQTWTDGGDISLSIASPGALLSLGNDVALRASGGAWINAKGALVGGSGGSITLNAGAVAGPEGAVNSGLDVGTHLSIDGFGVNGSAGGIFNLTAPRVEISAGAGSWTTAQQVDDSVAPGGVFQIYSSLFSGYGFESINVNASGLIAPGALTTNLLTVDAGTAINATVSSLVLGPLASTRPSAATVDAFATVTSLAPYLRPPESVSLSALPPTTAANTAQLGGTVAGDVTIGTGASIATDAGGSISLTSLDSIVVDGALRAPGGSVSLHIVSPGVTPTGAAAPPYQGFEAGFLPNQRIELGSTGSIDVSGTFVFLPSALNLDVGTAYAGGSVNLFADRGAVVTDSGSKISIAGASAPLDVLQANGTYGHEAASTAGGSMAVRSGESISLRGDIAAAAGATGSSGTAAAGSLDVELTRSEPWWNVTNDNDFSTYPLTVELLPSIAGLPVSPANSNQAVLGAAQLVQSGIDALRIEAGSQVELSGAVSLGLARQMVIDAPVIAATGGAHVNLSAPYLEVGYELLNQVQQNGNAATGGTGTVNFSGAEIDLVGQTVFQGATNVAFASLGDLVLRGQPLGSGTGNLVGSLTNVGNLTLSAARIYPVTATNFAIEAQDGPGAAGSVKIAQSDSNPGAPLSAGGALSITADTVASTGTLYAPFGSISLTANKDLTLGDGSTTSVSGAGLIIPYGETQFGGEQWIYPIYSNTQTVAGVPTRAVQLTAPAVTIAKRATIDLSGGGDLSAFEWVPGSGGTSDALGSTPGLYAILPSTRGQASPQDPLISITSPTLPGESVYLSGGAGLAAGTYPLLPARYALLPGALLIQVEPAFKSTKPGSLGTLADGTPVVAGYFSYGSTGLHQTPGYGGFAIYPGSHGGQLAEYDQSLASTYFSAAASAAGAPRPTLPADAGALTIDITGMPGLASALNIGGQVRTSAASGGLAAPIEISAADLVIGTPNAAVPSDAVSVSGSVLASWQPGSLLLGGATSADGGSIDVLANTVTIGAATTLTADQIVLVAAQSIDVQKGATLQSTSAAAGAAPKTLPASKTLALSGQGNGNAGFLAVSDLNWLIPARAADASAAGGATVAIEAGGSVASRGSLSIDGTGGVLLNGLGIGPGAEWSLGSSSIAIVPAGARADALSIGPGLLAQLGAAGAVRLASTGTIDLMVPVNLGVSAGGSPTLESLTLAASSINNLTGAQGSAGVTTSRFGAQKLILQGADTSAAGSVGTAGPAGAGLAFVAGELDVGPNALAINGFASTRATVSGAVVGEGAAALNVGGDLTIAAAGVTAAAQTDPSLTGSIISATGALSVTPAGTASKGRVPLLLGGDLTLSGATVDISGAVTIPSGNITLLAAQGGLTIANGATLDTAGRMVSIGNQSVGTPGGIIAVNAADDLTLSSGATLNVSGAGAAAGGAVSLTAGGVTGIGAALKGSGGAGAAGGSFSLDAGSLRAVDGTGANPLDTLAAALRAGGFNDAVGVRVRTGDLTLDAAATLSANSVALTADAGNVLIDGTIDAPSGALRGTLDIFGGTGVELGKGGQLHADGSGASGLGGSIEIGTGRLVADSNGVLDAYNGGTIRLDSGSTISAAGKAGMGTLLLRAPALVAADDVGIQSLLSDTRAVGEVIVEPVLPFNTTAFSSSTAPSAADFQQVNQSVGNYMAAAAANIASRLAPGGTAFMLEAGVEIIAPGPLTLQSSDGSTPALDLQTWRFNGAPVDLTVRAAGNITVANTITDGFAADPNLNQPTLLTGPSSSIRLIAGADISSANPLAVTPLASTPDGSGTLTIGASTPGAAPAVIRTGTGNLDLVAARDIVLEGAGDGAYTAGTPAVSPILVQGTGLLMSFPTGGGNLAVRAGEDIENLMQTAPGGVPNWQLRVGGSVQTTPPEWGINLAAYNWNFGTLGGGDLQISAGRDALNVSAAAADSLLPRVGDSPQYVTGGGLSLAAGRNIGSAQVFLADGTGSVAAAGALTAVLPSIDASSGDPNVGSVFYLQSSTIDVAARLGVDVDGVFNPTALALPHPARALLGAFFSYGDTSALNLESAAGDIDFGRAGGAGPTLLGLALNSAQPNSSLHGNDVFPANLSVAAPSGNIFFGAGIGNSGTLALYPSANGQLDLLAAQNITQSGGGRLIVSDAAPGSISTVVSPAGTTGPDSNSAAFNGDLHGADAAPALVTAGGNIEDLSLSIPKAAQVAAGQDIVDLTYAGQNLKTTDQTVVMAGRDFVFSDNYSGNGISVGGPGQLDLLAGRNVSLGFPRNGIVTTGNLENPNLPTSQGADLTIMTGLGTAPDFAGFLKTIILPSATYQADLVSYVESLQGSANLSFNAAEAAFQGLPPDQQRPLIDKVFFNELLLSGRADNTTPGAGFAEGYAAIDALFPGSRVGAAGAAANAYAGDLTLDFSRIYTLSGGNINLIVPGGLINVGLANAPALLGNRDPSTLGIVAEGAGSVDIYARGDVNVNSSRIFTLGGGNILIWSDEGSIDAGRGAKTAVSAPPPSVLINSDGTVTLNFAGAAAGSGIRTIQTDPNVALGDVDLIAPVGTVNAGDAGIGAAGNINIAARQVVGLDNIQFGGTSSGVPSQVSNIGASLSGASNAAAGASNTATSSAATGAADKEAAAPLAQNALSWLDVFVTGLGEENCKPDDIDCLRRQKAPTR